MSRMPPRSIPCTKCGECCRHGGECIFRNWAAGNEDVLIKFEGKCQFLRKDNMCTQLIRAFEEHPKSLDRFVDGRCDWPAQFVHHYAPELFKTIILPNKEEGEDDIFLSPEDEDDG